MLRCDSPRDFKIVEDENGYIVAQGIIATAGEKLVYHDAVETISEGALFDNIESWEGLPVTLQHPDVGLLDPETTQEHQVGSVIKAWREGDSLWAKFKITVRDAIDSVKSGLRGLSAGYSVVMDGDKQTARMNNHLALCDVGRSPSSGIRGDERRDSFDIGVKKHMLIKFPNGGSVKLDCSDAEGQLLQTKIDALKAKLDEVEAGLKKVDEQLSETLDDDSDMEIAEKLAAIKAKIEAAEEAGEASEELKKLQAQYDELKAQMDEDDDKIDSDELNSLIDTLEKAQEIDESIKLRGDSGKIKTELELIAEALKAHNPNIKLDAHGDDISYMRARLDAAIEMRTVASVSRQRGGFVSQRADSNTLTVQQRANQAFYGGK